MLIITFNQEVSNVLLSTFASIKSSLELRLIYF